MHKDQFAALASALDALGHDANVDVGTEERSITGVVVVYVALRLAERVTDDALDAIIDRVKATLRNLRRPQNGEKRHAVIFAPDEDILAEIELEDDDERGLNQPSSESQSQTPDITGPEADNH
jgi:hypothetical protein